MNPDSNLSMFEQLSSNNEAILCLVSDKENMPERGFNLVDLLYDAGGWEIRYIKHYSPEKLQPYKDISENTWKVAVPLYSQSLGLQENYNNEFSLDNTLRDLNVNRKLVISIVSDLEITEPIGERILLKTDGDNLLNSVYISPLTEVNLNDTYPYVEIDGTEWKHAKAITESDLIIKLNDSKQDSGIKIFEGLKDSNKGILCIVSDTPGIPMNLQDITSIDIINKLLIENIDYDLVYITQYDLSIEKPFKDLQGNRWLNAKQITEKDLLEGLKIYVVSKDVSIMCKNLASISNSFRDDWELSIEEHGSEKHWNYSMVINEEHLSVDITHRFIVADSLKNLNGKDVVLCQVTDHQDKLLDLPGSLLDNREPCITYITLYNKDNPEFAFEDREGSTWKYAVPINADSLSFPIQAK